VYSVAPVAGASGYSWTAPPGAAIVSGNGTVQAIVDYPVTFATGDLCVTADNVCGSGTPKCVTIRRIDVPAKPKPVSGQRYAVCKSVQAYHVNAVAEATVYAWTFGPGAAVIGGAGTKNVQVAFDSSFQASYACVTAGNKCGVSPQRCKFISPLPKDIDMIYGPSTACAFQAGLVFSVDPVPGATSYAWQEPNTVTFVSGQGTPSIVADWGIKTKALYVSAVNECGGSAPKKKVVKVTCRTTGQGVEPMAALTVVPNPASDAVDIILDDAGGGEALLIVTDLLGEELVRERLRSRNGRTTWHIGLDRWPAGMYPVTVVTPMETIVRKLIVE